MSDARNSSGNVRGGGAKQTGGSGRTAKGVAGQKGSGSAKGGDGLDLFEKEVDRKTEAKRALQLQIMSKQLASSVKAACLTAHTEAEYETFHIPMPDPGAALKKLKAMIDFTRDWYDKEFREQWLTSVQEVWQEELRAEYEAAVAAAAAAQRGASSSTSTAAAAAATEDGKALSIEELEAMIENVDISTEERKKLKKKLKKRRQKENKKSRDGEEDD